LQNNAAGALGLACGTYWITVLQLELTDRAVWRMLRQKFPQRVAEISAITVQLQWMSLK
jgi:hypothetical protein